MSVQYTGGCSIHRGMFSTLGDVQYTGGCSIHWGMFNTLGDVQYTGGCSIHWGMFNTLGDIMSTLGDIMINVGRSLGKQFNLYGNPSLLNPPHCTHDIPYCTHDIPHCTHNILPLYSKYPPTVLTISSHCTEHAPVYS